MDTCSARARLWGNSQAHHTVFRCCHTKLPHNPYGLSIYVTLNCCCFPSLSMLQVSVAACIEDAEKNKKKCRGRADAVKEALIVFFSSTACGLPLPQPPTSSPVPCIPLTVSGSHRLECGYACIIRVWIIETGWGR